MIWKQKTLLKQKYGMIRGISMIVKLTKGIEVNIDDEELVCWKQEKNSVFITLKGENKNYRFEIDTHNKSVKEIL